MTPYPRSNWSASGRLPTVRLTPCTSADGFGRARQVFESPRPESTYRAIGPRIRR